MNVEQVAVDITNMPIKERVNKLGDLPNEILIGIMEYIDASVLIKWYGELTDNRRIQLIIGDVISRRSIYITCEELIYYVQEENDEKCDLLLSQVSSFKIDVSESNIYSLESLTDAFEKNISVFDKLTGSRFKFLIPNVDQESSNYTLQLNLLNELYDILHNRVYLEIELKEVRGTFAQQLDKLINLPQIKGTAKTLLPINIRNSSNNYVNIVSEKDMQCFIEYVVSAENDLRLTECMNILSPLKINFTHEYWEDRHPVMLDEEKSATELFLTLLYRKHPEISLSIDPRWIENHFFAEKMREAHINNLANPLPAKIINLSIKARNGTWSNFSFFINNNFYLKHLSILGSYDLSDINHNTIDKLKSVTLSWKVIYNTVSKENFNELNNLTRILHSPSIKKIIIPDAENIGLLFEDSANHITDNNTDKTLNTLKEIINSRNKIYPVKLELRQSIGYNSANSSIFTNRIINFANSIHVGILSLNNILSAEQTNQYGSTLGHSNIKKINVNCRPNGFNTNMTHSFNWLTLDRTGLPSISITYPKNINIMAQEITQNEHCSISLSLPDRNTTINNPYQGKGFFRIRIPNYHPEDRSELLENATSELQATTVHSVNLIPR